MDKRDPRLSASIRGYDSDELFRKDLWLRRIADSRRKLATMREDKANGAHTASVKRSNETLELLKKKIKLLEMEETKKKALMLADLIASREVLLLLTVDEATEELRGLLNKLDAETQKEIMERACGFLECLNRGSEVIRMDRRYVNWLASGAVTFALAFAGCQKKEEPVPTANTAPAAAPAGNVPAGAGAVATGPTGSDVGPGTSAATERTKTPDKQEAGKKTF